MYVTTKYVFENFGGAISRLPSNNNQARLSHGMEFVVNVVLKKFVPTSALACVRAVAMVKSCIRLTADPVFAY